MKLFKSDWEKNQAAQAKLNKAKAESLQKEAQHRSLELSIKQAEQEQNRKVAEAQEELAKAEAKAILTEARIKEEAAKPESVRLAEVAAKAEAKKREEEERNWADPDRVYLLEIPGTVEEMSKFISKGASLIETLTNSQNMNLKHIQVVEKKIVEAQALLEASNPALASVAFNRIQQAKEAFKYAQLKEEETKKAKKKRRLIKYGAITTIIFLLWLFNSGVLKSKPPLSKLILSPTLETSCALKLVSLETVATEYDTDIIAVFGNDGGKEEKFESAKFTFTDESGVLIGEASFYSITIPAGTKVKEELSLDFELIQHLKTGASLTCTGYSCTKAK